MWPIFLKPAISKPDILFPINKERKDLALHPGKSIKDPVGVNVEVKRLHTAKTMTAEKPNAKALHELVHLIGLEEIKDGSKKLIQPKSATARSEASLLENTIIKLTDKETLSAKPFIVSL